MSEREINQRVADQIRNEGRLNGTQFHRGECMALLDGNVVAVTQDLASALRGLRALDADPGRGVVFEVEQPVADVIR